MPTLLEYLTAPNLDVDRSTLPHGTNTIPVGDYEVEGVRPWSDFTLETILACFGDILHSNIPGEDTIQPPPIALHHLFLTGEASVDAILKKHNHVIIDNALQLAQPRLQGRGLCLPISFSWGSLSYIDDDPRLCPDWAGTVHSGRPPYVNRVPGDTKQSENWRSTMNNSLSTAVREEFLKPLRQLLLYCIRTKTRYGYILTDLEAVVFRRTKSEEPSAPLSQNRPRRQPPTTHQRVTSLSSVISETSRMSLDTSGSPYTDEGNPDVDEAPLEMAVIPWANSGVEKISINLAIWFIHLLAASDISIEESYPTLGTWQRESGDDGRTFYRQIGSRRTSEIIPDRGVLVRAVSLA